MRILLKILPVVIFTLFGANMAMAQFTILPDSKGATLDQCKDQIRQVEAVSDRSVFYSDTDIRNMVLACAIMTGKVSLEMLPYFVTYIANFMLSLGGIIAVLFIVIGGYNYIYGGVMDQKEKGKKTITHALMGLMMGILSWVIVQVIITAVTS